MQRSFHEDFIWLAITLAQYGPRDILCALAVTWNQLLGLRRRDGRFWLCSPNQILLPNKGELQDWCCALHVLLSGSTKAGKESGVAADHMWICLRVELMSTNELSDLMSAQQVQSSEPPSQAD